MPFRRPRLGSLTFPSLIKTVVLASVCSVCLSGGHRCWAEPAAGATDPQAPIPVEVEADEQDADMQHDLQRLHGDARVTSEGREIRADEITANLRTDDVDAAGCVQVTAAGRRIEGDRAKGN